MPHSPDKSLQEEILSEEEMLNTAIQLVKDWIFREYSEFSPRLVAASMSATRIENSDTYAVKITVNQPEHGHLEYTFRVKPKSSVNPVVVIWGKSSD